MIDSYNQAACEYDDETVDFWKQFPEAFFDKFAELNRQGKVLNIGSGPGRDGLILKQKGLQVTCLDASEAMVKLSAQKGLESVVGNFFNLPFNGDSFDAVWAYTSLLHVPKSQVDKAIEEIVRVLKPHGYLSLGMIEGNEEGYFERSSMPIPRWFSFYTKEEIKELLHRYNFQVVHFEQFQPRTKVYLNFIAQKTK